MKKKNKSIKFNDKETGVKASIDENGFLHLDNLPLARSGLVEQPISVVGEEFPSLTNEDKTRGWFLAYRAPEDIFSAKALSSWCGVPLIRDSSGSAYSKATAKELCICPVSEPVGNRPFGTVQFVWRGKGKKSNVLFGHAIIWNVHDFAREFVSRSAWAIAPCFYVRNDATKKAGASVVQKAISPNCAFMTHHDTYGFNVMSPKKGLHKWLQKNIVDAILPSPAVVRKRYACSTTELIAAINRNGDELKPLNSFWSLEAAKKDKFMMRKYHNIGAYFIVYGDGKKRLLDEKYYFNGRDFVAASRIGLSPIRPAEKAETSTPQKAAVSGRRKHSTNKTNKRKNLD